MRVYLERFVIPILVPLAGLLIRGQLGLGQTMGEYLDAAVPHQFAATEVSGGRT